jgi:hypothetical protein
MTYRILAYDGCRMNNRKFDYYDATKEVIKNFIILKHLPHDKLIAKTIADQHVPVKRTNVRVVKIKNPK